MTANNPNAPPPGQKEIRIDHIDQALHTAPLIHVDGAHGLLSSDRTVMLNLFQDRMLAGPGIPLGIERVVCARLVMSQVVFKEFVEWLAKNGSKHFPKEGG